MGVLEGKDMRGRVITLMIGLGMLLTIIGLQLIGG
jgi:hypothetical protein